jgi:hypothetical protein
MTDALMLFLALAVSFTAGGWWARRYHEISAGWFGKVIDARG